MKITIECTPLQLSSISEALQIIDYSIIKERNIPKEGWALAVICQEWGQMEKVKRRKDSK